MIVFSVYEDDRPRSWIGSTILNDDQAAVQQKLIEASERHGLRWESVKPDSHEDLLGMIEDPS